MTLPLVRSGSAGRLAQRQTELGRLGAGMDGCGGTVQTSTSQHCSVYQICTDLGLRASALPAALTLLPLLGRLRMWVLASGAGRRGGSSFVLHLSQCI